MLNVMAMQEKEAAYRASINLVSHMDFYFGEASNTTMIYAASVYKCLIWRNFNTLVIRISSEDLFMTVSSTITKFRLSLKLGFSKLTMMCL